MRVSSWDPTKTRCILWIRVVFNGGFSDVKWPTRFEENFINFFSILQETEAKTANANKEENSKTKFPAAGDLVMARNGSTKMFVDP